MDLGQLLDETHEEIVAEAAEALARAQLTHYDESTGDQNRERLASLCDLARRCVRERNLLPMVEYSHEVARSRYRDGFDLGEVQTAFNVLEEAIWKRITARLPPESYPEAFGMASTVLGAGKQALALEYVNLVSHARTMETLDLTAMFKGTT